MTTPHHLTAWAKRHGVTQAALADLLAMMGVAESAPVKSGKSEAAVQTEIRLAASKLGGRLWRNNVGAGKLEDGSFVRWGLANDSKAMNTAIKSSDLIGILPTVVTPEMVGTTVGVFWSVEVKKEGWRFGGSPREVAQLRWIELVRSLGGVAYFSTGGLADGRIL